MSEQLTYTDVSAALVAWQAAEKERDEAIRQRDESYQQMLSANAAREDAEDRLAAVRAGLDTAMAERDEFIRQRDDAHHIALTALEREQAAGKRETEALDELNAAEQALTECAVTDGETLSERIRELATRAAKYHGALAVATTERDNCREVLHREREERAAEKATLGAALQALRAETDTVDRLHEENERLAAQLEFAERVLISGIRRAIP